MDHFSKREITQFLLKEVCLQPIDVVKKMCGVYCLEYNQYNVSFMLVDGMSHFWNVKISPSSLEVQDG